MRWFLFLTLIWSPRLPDWEEFTNEKREAVAKFEAARKARGQASAEHADSTYRARAIIEAQFKRAPSAKPYENDQVLVEDILKNMRQARVEMARDPILAQRFSTRVYVDYYRETIALLKTYLDWYESRKVPKSPPRNPH